MKPQKVWENSEMTRGHATTPALTYNLINQENYLYKGTGGVSQENRALGFKPAFIDRDTGVIYLSRFADGKLAPCHILDGLPDYLVESRDSSGKVTAAKASVEAGFFKAGYYYSRKAASEEVEGHGKPTDLIFSHMIL